MTWRRLWGTTLWGAALCCVRGDDASAAEAPKPEPALQCAAVWGDAAFRHAGTITSVRTMPDGRQILTTGQDGTARLWDLETGRELKRFYHPDSASLWDAVLLPGDKELLTCGDNGVIARWDLASGRRLATYTQNGTVFRLAPDPTGTTFAATDSKNGLTLWHTAEGKALRRFEGHAESVYTALFSPDGATLLSGSEDKTMRYWNPKTGATLHTVQPGGEVFTLAPSPDGTRLLACMSDKTVRVLARETGAVAWTASFKDSPHTAAWSPDGQQIAAGTDEGEFALLNAQTGAVLTQAMFSGVTQQWGTAFTADGKSVLLGANNGLVRLEAATGQPLFPPPDQPAPIQSIQALGWSAAVNAAVILDSQNDVRSLDAEGTRSDAILPPPPPDEDGNKDYYSGMAVSPDGKRLAVRVSRAGKISIQSLGVQTPAVQLFSADRAACMAFDPTGQKLLVGGSNGSSALYDAATGRALQTLIIPPPSKRNLGGVGDGEFIGQGVEDFDDFDFESSYRSNPSARTLAFSADGLRAAMAYDDEKLRVWDLKTGRLVKTYSLSDETPSACAFLPGDHGAVLAAVGRRLSLWPSLESQAVKLDAEAVRRLAERLGDPSFRERDAATKKLIELGAPALELLDPPESYRDPEVRERLKRVQATAEKNEEAVAPSISCLFEKNCTALLFWPDSRHWLAVVGEDAMAEVVLGEYAEGALRVLERVSDGHGANTLAFGPEPDTLLVGHRDGTVALYTLHLKKAANPR